MTNPIATPVRVEKSTFSGAWDLKDANGKFIATGLREMNAKRFCFALNNHDPLVEALRCTTESLAKCKRQLERLEKPFVHNVELDGSRAVIAEIEKGVKT